MLAISAPIAMGVLPDGTHAILGLWIEGSEGANFWMKVFNDLMLASMTS
jgi:putative transposase